MSARDYCAIAFCPFILVLQLGCSKATQDNAEESTKTTGLIRLVKRPASPIQVVFEADLPQAVADSLANSEALET